MPRRAARNTVMVRRPTTAQIQAMTASKNATPPRDIDVEVSGLDIASLTLDTPLIPFVPKRRVPKTPFHFLSLPAEVRISIYAHFFDDDENEEGDVLDLEPRNYRRFHKKLAIIRVCRLVREEATHYFYSTRSFRIFPIFPGRYFKTKRPLLARLKPHQRACLTSIQLRVGPGWGAPPRGWVVNDALGLADCTNVRTISVFVENDPSDSIYNGFRRDEGFYEDFCRNLLSKILESMPAITAIQFDGHPSVKKTGHMMKGLLDLAHTAGKSIQWGPLRGWTDADEQPELPMKKASWEEMKHRQQNNELHSVMTEAHT
ncbi:unnamed protein product [Clonostachys rhizophaga]|uniref:Uncharacterized protein n=1 Tax=Clonostachys rhizophaga TaxID=160324 RepID=A0A9N9VQR3_9HYPO|nr:unnamed protein product [Clonostachys rhizophaga]